MKRRSFVLNSSMATAAVLGQPISQLNKSVSANDKISIGVIGTGSRGLGLIKSLLDVPQFQIEACCDILPFRLDEAMEHAQSASRHKDYREVLDRQDLDAVIIATPLYLHHEMATAAMEADKHIYLEKTMTFHIDEALDLVDKCKDYPRIFQVGHQYRATPLYFQIAEIIRAGYIGQVTSILVQWNRNGDWRRPVPDPSLEKIINWRMYRAYSSGLTAELHSHQLDYINWIFDQRPVRIMGMGGIDYWKDGRETFDNVNTLFEYPNGMKVNCVSLTANAHEGYAIKFKGSKGTIVLDMHKATLYPEALNEKEKGVVDGVSGATMNLGEKEGIELPANNEKGYSNTRYALMAFNESINTGKMPASNVTTGARAAISVRLAVDAMMDGEVKTWDDGYGV